MPRKTTKKPTTRKAAPKKAAPKRKKYQTGGAAKPMPPRTMQGMPLATGQRMSTTPAQPLSQEAERKRQEMIRRDRAMMEVGNRQRAAAFDAAKKRAAAQAARTQRPAQGPSRAQAARNQAEYEAAMRARQQRGSTPARPRVPTAQQRAEYQRMVSNINRDRANAVPVTPRQQPRPQMRTPTPQELAQLRANPNRPSMANQVQTLNQAAQTQRAQQRAAILNQIAQLQARLRQLGG
tara:strand:+ start:2000 stop:2707 length:708 start_codon:yes stop_codon:yes gene_type:complete